MLNITILIEFFPLLKGVYIFLALSIYRSKIENVNISLIDPSALKTLFIYYNDLENFNYIAPLGSGE